MTPHEIRRRVESGETVHVSLGDFHALFRDFGFHAKPPWSLTINPEPTVTIKKHKFPSWEEEDR